MRSLQVAQRVPVLGEDDQLLLRRGRRPQDRAIAAVLRGLPGPARRPVAVKISPSRLASSRHFVSRPVRRTPSARASSLFRVAISAFSSAMERAAVAWSRMRVSASSTSGSGASSRSSTSSASSSGAVNATVGDSWPPRWSTSSSRRRFSNRSRRRRNDR